MEALHSAVTRELPDSAHTTRAPSGQSPADRRTERSDSDILVSEYHKVPLHVRAQAEAWELPREEVQLLSLIAEGQGGMVYQCRWRGLDCVAKMLASDSDTTREFADMINELSTVSHLRHPNLVLFLGACTRERPLILVSEYLMGGNLEDWTKRQAQMKPRTKGRAPVEVAMRWCMDLARAVCYLHNCTTPVIHRDLKPANLLLTDDLRLKVSDFGLSKTLQLSHQDPYQMTGLKGTVRYMAPEVIQGQGAYTEKVDLYSSAMIFWYVATGAEPYGDMAVDDIAQAAAEHKQRPPLAPVSARFPAEFAELIARCWSHEPELRPPAEIVVDELELISQEARAGKKDGLVSKCCVS
eukprot:Tamp_16958.p1 GENE.Tamp_16958~~Tamp_16958.p1  ORF type:complete len:371 (+),score=49.31 Tamp_16958:54-1115(+)